MAWRLAGLARSVAVLEIRKAMAIQSYYRVVSVDREAVLPFRFETAIAAINEAKKLFDDSAERHYLVVEKDDNVIWGTDWSKWNRFRNRLKTINKKIGNCLLPKDLNSIDDGIKKA